MKEYKDLFETRETIEEKRDQIAQFLQEILDFVEEKDEIGGFDFSDYVKQWDKVHKCGTVCCMEGWLPAIFPDKVHWSEYLVRINGEERSFYPSRVGIPLSHGIWITLTAEGTELNPSASFSEVKQLWEDIISEIKQGELDHEIL